MASVGIVLVSHSAKVVEGIKEIIREVIRDVPIEIAGGTDDGDIGTSIDKINAAIEQADSGQGVLLFYDLGSAKMNAEMAIETYEKNQVILVEAPILEGAYVGAVEASIGNDIHTIIENIHRSFEK